MGTCEGPGAGEEAYSDYSEYYQSCCLDSGVHTLTCKDSYGDGWKWASFNGYLEIDGVRYCEDFNSGYEQITNVTFSGRLLNIDSSHYTFLWWLGTVRDTILVLF